MSVVYNKVRKTHLAPTANEWGTMEWSVFREDDYGRPIEAQLRFRDCFGKPVCLDFNAGKLKNVKPRVDKIDHMIAELEAFKKSYLEACKTCPFIR